MKFVSVEAQLHQRKNNYLFQDGLRGTLVMLTNTTGLDGTNAAGLSQSELETIEGELSEEYDVYQELSEVMSLCKKKSVNRLTFSKIVAIKGNSLRLL